MILLAWTSSLTRPVKYDLKVKAVHLVDRIYYYVLTGAPGLLGSSLELMAGYP